MSHNSYTSLNSYFIPFSNLISLANKHCYCAFPLTSTSFDQKDPSICLYCTWTGQCCSFTRFTYYIKLFNSQKVRGICFCRIQDNVRSLTGSNSHIAMSITHHVSNNTELQSFAAPIGQGEWIHLKQQEEMRNVSSAYCQKGWYQYSILSPAQKEQ